MKKLKYTLIILGILFIPNFLFAYEAVEGVDQSSGCISDEAYNAITWDSDTCAASKNAIRDKIETLAGGHDAVTLAADFAALFGLSTQELTVDSATANYVLAGPVSGAAADPTMRALVDDDIPNTITIDTATTATTATTANAGDSATAFFAAGTIEHERGGLEADVSAYDGVVKISGGSTSALAVDGTGDCASGSVCLGDHTHSGYQTGDSQLTELAGISAATAGDMLYASGANVWANLAKGTANQLLQMNSGATLPEWTSSISIDSVDLSSGWLKTTNSTDPTINAAGKIGIDTTDDQLTFYGSAQRTLRYEEEACVTLENLAADDDSYAFTSFRDAVTITGVWCHYRGTGTTPATFTLEDGAGNAMTITDTNPTCAASTGAATPKAVTAGNTLTAYEMLAFDVTNAVSPETDAYTICVSYTVTEQ